MLPTLLSDVFLILLFRIICLFFFLCILSIESFIWILSLRYRILCGYRFVAISSTWINDCWNNIPNHKCGKLLTWICNYVSRKSNVTHEKYLQNLNALYVTIATCIITYVLTHPRMYVRTYVTVMWTVRRKRWLWLGWWAARRSGWYRDKSGTVIETVTRWGLLFCFYSILCFCCRFRFYFFFLFLYTLKLFFIYYDILFAWNAIIPIYKCNLITCCSLFHQA